MGTPQNADLHKHYLRSLGGKKTSTAKFLLAPITSKRGKPTSGSSPLVQTDEIPESQPVNQDQPLGIEDLDPQLQETISDEEEGLPIMALPAIKPEFFSGKPGEKAEPWLQDLNRICKTIYKQNEEQIQNSFMYYLTGQAKAWYNSLPQAIKSDVTSVLELFKKRFDGSDAALAVSQVKQAPSESVSDYTTRYLQTMCQLEMPELWKLTTYVDGLKPTIRRIVKPQKLEDVEEARQAALRAENSELDSAEVSAIASPVQNQMTQLAKQMQELVETVSQLALQQKQQQQYQYYNAADTQMAQPPPHMGYGYPVQQPYQPPTVPHPPHPAQLPPHHLSHPQQPPPRQPQDYNRPRRNFKGKGRNISYSSQSHQQGSHNGKTGFNVNQNNNH